MTFFAQFSPTVHGLVIPPATSIQLPLLTHGLVQCSRSTSSLSTIVNPTLPPCKCKDTPAKTLLPCLLTLPGAHGCPRAQGAAFTISARASGLPQHMWDSSIFEMNSQAQHLFSSSTLEHKSALRHNLYIHHGCRSLVNRLLRSSCCALNPVSLWHRHHRNIKQGLWNSLWKKPFEQVAVPDFPPCHSPPSHQKVNCSSWHHLKQSRNQQKNIKNWSLGVFWVVQLPSNIQHCTATMHGSESRQNWIWSELPAFTLSDLFIFLRILAFHRLPKFRIFVIPEQGLTKQCLPCFNMQTKESLPHSCIFGRPSCTQIS